jgi:hypothetical protein
LSFAKVCQLVARLDKVSRVHVGMLVDHFVVRERKFKGRTTYVRLCEDHSQMISCSWVWLEHCGSATQRRTIRPGLLVGNASIIFVAIATTIQLLRFPLSLLFPISNTIAMFRPVVRRAAVQASRSSAPSRRFLSTAPPHAKSRSWKNSAVRWTLAGTLVYYYNTSNVFAEEQSCKRILC